MSKTFGNSIVEEIRARLEGATHQYGYFVSLASDPIIRFWSGAGEICSFFTMSAVDAVDGSSTGIAMCQIGSV